MRIALGIEYDGTDFMGWQLQAQGPTVQGTVEAAASFVAAEDVRLICAGRTDTGVHARGQVVHFETNANRPGRAWLMGINSRLPASVCVTWAQPVADDFHARYSAIARRYRYTILNRPVRPALDARQVAWERLPLDAAAMHDAAQVLLGEHDFTSFRTVACQSRTPIRRIEAIRVQRSDASVIVEIRANAFLHHMVRNIVGSLLAVGRGDQPVAWVGEVLALRDRALAAPTAPAGGLVFEGPLYPARFGLPAAFSSAD